MHKNATKCNKTQSKWCKNKHVASKIIDTFETYQAACAARPGVPRCSHPPLVLLPTGMLQTRVVVLQRAADVVLTGGRPCSHGRPSMLPSSTGGATGGYAAKWGRRQCYWRCVVVLQRAANVAPMGATCFLVPAIGGSAASDWRRCCQRREVVLTGEQSMMHAAATKRGQFCILATCG
jgi:hypothetical protein